VNDGQAAITRPVKVGSITATFAARFATLPATIDGTVSHAGDGGLTPDCGFD
jgi:hypothetical protein